MNFKIMFLLIWTLALAGLLMAVYLRRVYSRFSSCGVKTFRPLPIVGNMLDILTRKKNFVEDSEVLYYKYPEERFLGKYEFMNPIVVARDLELIKKVTIKDFEYFIDHRGVIDAKREPMFGRNLFSLKGQEWKDMRATLSPAFTSSKIKLMAPFMTEVGTQMLSGLEKRIKASGGDIDVDVKDLTTRYANDVIASCAFGLKVNSHAEKNNTFYEMGKSVSTIKYKQLFIFTVYASFPSLLKWLNINIFAENAKSFFNNLVLDTIADREAKNIIRPDMIHLLMQTKREQLSHEDQNKNDVSKDAGLPVVEESEDGIKSQPRVWSDDDLVAQAVLFFVAGFETISSAMSFALHEIAMHTEVQERLVQEIKEFDKENNGKIEYNSIQNMTYMDMVVSEVLRLWPPLGTLDRLCVKDYNLGKPNDKATCDYVIRRGENLAIPTWPIHRDPKYFPNPLKFDPERFSEENKHQINPFTYMPFGVGPRNCIGSRFALYELKVFLYQILLRIEVFPSEKLQKPITMVKGSFTISIEGGHWLRFRIRT